MPERVLYAEECLTGAMVDLDANAGGGWRLDGGERGVRSLARGASCRHVIIGEREFVLFPDRETGPSYPPGR